MVFGNSFISLIAEALIMSMSFIITIYLYLTNRQAKLFLH